MNSHFRRHLFSLLLLFGILVSWTASAQAPISNLDSSSMGDRVTQVERILNANSQLLTQLQYQLSNTQRDVDSLRGQIQENQYQLNQVVERQKQIYQQINSMGSLSSTPLESFALEAGSGASTSTVSNNADATVAPNSTDDANSDYNAAAALVLEKKQYDMAIAVFQMFVKKYPDSTYQPNANYWLGQLNYNKGKKNDAAYYFANVVKNYPKSHKSSEALLKIGIIMQEKGQMNKSKAVYQQVIKQYPNTESAKQAQKRLTRL